ncbi:MAG: MerR family DNA-binding transcriptional regulator [Chloroflexia bacterium]
MPPKHIRTTDVARELGVHPNTVRLYEADGFVPIIPRGANKYRLYTPTLLEYARLAYITLHWPYLATDKPLLEDLVKSAVNRDLGMAMEHAYTYLVHVRMERTMAEAAIEFLERWAAGYLMDSPRERINISKAAQRLNVTIDMLRNWERNGLIEVPRDPQNQYRLYGTVEFGRLRVIRTLVKSGYSLMAIFRMLQQFDAGETVHLRDALYIPREEDEHIQIIADRWLTGLLDLEQRALATIRQLSLLIETAHSS